MKDLRDLKDFKKEEGRRGGETGRTKGEGARLRRIRCRMSRNHIWPCVLGGGAQERGQCNHTILKGRHGPHQVVGSVGGEDRIHSKTIASPTDTGHSN